MNQMYKRIQYRYHSLSRINRYRSLLTAAAFGIAAAMQTSVLAQAGNPPKKAGTDTAGTAQLKGGEAQIGTIYTFTHNGVMINAKLVSAEYSVSRFNVQEGTTISPKAGEKLIILHWQLKNPMKKDLYIGRSFMAFSTVAADGQTRVHSAYNRLTTEKTAIATTLKPGQPLPSELLAVGVVPAAGPVGKLILDWGRVSTSDLVTRYNLSQAPNLVKPLPTTDADASDASGATALLRVPATVGTVYPLAAFDVKVESIAFVPGPIGAVKAGPGKRFLVVTVSSMNKMWHKEYVKNQFSASLLTADDEKTTKFVLLKGKRDEPVEGNSLEPDESSTVRLAFAVPADTAGKKLSLSLVMDNTGSLSRSLDFDLTDVK